MEEETIKKIHGLRQLKGCYQHRKNLSSLLSRLLRLLIIDELPEKYDSGLS